MLFLCKRALKLDLYTGLELLYASFVTSDLGRCTVIWGSRLAWSRIPAWGAGDPGFKSQLPHHFGG